MDVWMVWVIIAVVLFIVELITPGTFYFFCIGIGAIFAAAASALSGPLVTWTVFFVVSIIFILLSRPIIKKFNSQKTRDANVDEIVGSKGVVTEAIESMDKPGMVKVKGEKWLAKSNGKIKDGGEVKVIKAEGNYLIVEKYKTGE